MGFFLWGGTHLPLITVNSTRLSSRPCKVLNPTHFKSCLFLLFAVQLCLNAIKYVLPRDTALQLVTRWYNTHNAPGGPGSQSEWLVFSKCLLGSMGYNVEKLAIFSQVRLLAAVFAMGGLIKRD